MFDGFSDDDMGWLFAIVIFVGLVILAILGWSWLHQTWTYKAVITGDFKVTAETSFQRYQMHTYTTSDCSSHNSKGLCTGYTTHFHTYWSWDTQYTTQNVELDRLHQVIECNYDQATDGTSTRWTGCDIHDWMYVTYENTEKKPREAWCKRDSDDWKWIEVKSKIDITENRLLEVNCK